MVKKIILQLLISIVMILTMTIAFTVIVVHINKNKPAKKDRPYEMNATHEGLVQTVAHYLIKPLLESAFDRYIEKNGLAEYLEEMKQQTEVDLVNFYEIAEGEGSKAFCGQQVSLQMHKMFGGNILPFQTSDVTLEIGRDKLSLGVIGMKEGGERVVLVNDDNKNVDSYYVKLIEVKNKYPDSINNLMIFDNLTNKFGKKVKCGDEISIKYSIRKHNGELQIENQAVQFKVGDKKVPLAIELGVIGMKAGNNRTVIAPPDVLDGDEENISIIDLSL